MKGLNKRYADISCRWRRRIFFWTIPWLLPLRFCAWLQFWICIFFSGRLCFLVSSGRRKSPYRKYQWMGHTWYPNRCALEYRTQSFQCQRSWPFSILCPWPWDLFREFRRLCRLWRWRAWPFFRFSWYRKIWWWIWLWRVRVFVQLSPRGLWRLWWVCHQTLRHRCWGRAFRFWFIAWGFIFRL